MTSRRCEQHCHLEVGVPVKPMLAKPTHGVSEVLDRFTGVDFTCEYKYDGERAQVRSYPQRHAHSTHTARVCSGASCD